jgi:hypothetical protein
LGGQDGVFKDLTSGDIGLRYVMTAWISDFALTCTLPLGVG